MTVVSPIVRHPAPSQISVQDWPGQKVSDAAAPLICSEPFGVIVCAPAPSAPMLER